MKSCPVGTELFHADGRTDRQPDMTKLTVAFRNLAKAPEKRITNLGKHPQNSNTIHHKNIIQQRHRRM